MALTLTNLPRVARASDRVGTFGPTVTTLSPGGFGSSLGFSITGRLWPRAAPMVSAVAPIEDVGIEATLAVTAQA